MNKHGEQVDKSTIIDNIKRSMTALDLPSEFINSIIHDIELKTCNNQKNNDITIYRNTGFAAIDYLLSPIRINERIMIYGQPGSGKTMFAVYLSKVLSSQSKGKILWIDSSYKVNKEYLVKVGYHNDDVEFIRCNEITNQTYDLVSSGRYNTIVIDDLASFKETQYHNLSDLFFISSRNNVPIVVTDHVRVSMSGRIYSYDQRQTGNFDVVVYTKRESIDIKNDKINISAKLEYKTGEGSNIRYIIIPISRSGIINKPLLDTRIKNTIRDEGFETIDELIEYRLRSHSYETDARRNEGNPFKRKQSGNG